MRYLNGFIFLVLFLGQTIKTSGQPIGFDITGDRESIEIPFESFNNLIVIPVVLNHRIPLKFVLDTGVRTSILTERTFSDLLNISYNREIPLMGADGQQRVIAHVANGISLKLPGVEGSGQALLVLEEDYLQLRNYLGADVHGILGYELFSRFIVKIDYHRRVLTLYEPFSFKPQRSYKAVPINVVDTKPYLETTLTTLDGKKLDLKLMLDTGASHSLLLDYDNSPNLDLPENKVRCNLGRGLGGSIDGFIGRVSKVEFGKFEFSQPVVSFPDAGNFDEIFQKTGRQGTLGGGILNRFTVIVDYFNGYLYLRKNSGYKGSFEYNMSGIEVKAAGNKLNEFEVEEIRPGTPGEEAGIQPGDKLIRINSNLARDLKLSDVNGLFRSHHNRKMRVIIERNSQRIKVKFRLRRLI